MILIITDNFISLVLKSKSSFMVFNFFFIFAFKHKVMYKILLISFLTLCGLNAQEISISDFDVPIVETLLLKNGNKLNFAFENLDNNTSDSDCQCEDIFFGDVFWVFESNNNFEIVNQKCFQRDDLLPLFLINLPIPDPYSGASNTVYDNRGIWDYNGWPGIKDVFYLNDEIVIHFLEDYSGTSTYYQPTGASHLLKFDLTTFNFYDPIHYPTSYNYNYYGIIDKTLKFNDNHLMHMSYIAPQTNNSGQINATYNALRSKGYTNFYAQDEQFKRLALSISEIFEANADVVVLDYKKNSKNIISFLILTNALDGLYSQGLRYETSLFLIEVDFTNIEDLSYSVVKSDLQVPRNNSPSYEDYNVFINDENNFVLNFKPSFSQQSKTDYNYIHILSDDGDFKTIGLENLYSLEYNTKDGTSITIGGNIDSHKIIDIGFSQDTFMTLEEVYTIYTYGGALIYDTKIIKLFNYDGTVLRRYIFSPGFNGANTNLISDRFFTNRLDDITYINWNFSNSYRINLNFYGIDFNENSGYSIDTSSKNSDNPLFNFPLDSFLSTNTFENNSLEFSLRQNPVADNLIIEGLNYFDVRIFNVFSQKIIELKNTSSVDVSSLSKGVYFIEASDGFKSSVKKFIKL